jgi:hypothetical protein
MAILTAEVRIYSWVAKSSGFKVPGVPKHQHREAGACKRLGFGAIPVWKGLILGYFGVRPADKAAFEEALVWTNRIASSKPGCNVVFAQPEDHGKPDSTSLRTGLSLERRQRPAQQVAY